MIHPYVRAALAAERQASLLAEARAASRVRQSRRAAEPPEPHPGHPLRRLLLARVRRLVLSREVRASVAEIDNPCNTLADSMQAMLATIAADTRPARAAEKATP